MAFSDQYPRLRESARAVASHLQPLLKRRIVSLALIALGIILLGYVTGSYWEIYRSQRDLEAAWDQQAAAVNASEQPKMSPEQILTRIRVPKIGMDAIVVEGASVKELSEGPGHMRETAEPGETGNAVITGHRDTFFRHIYELTKGDQIQVQRNGRNFTYEVTSQKIVKPEDISVINPTMDSQLTLITCYPTYYIGPAPKRLVVFSKLVESNGQAAQAHATGQ